MRYGTHTKPNHHYLLCKLDQNNPSHLKPSFEFFASTEKHFFGPLRSEDFGQKLFKDRAQPQSDFALIVGPKTPNIASACNSGLSLVIGGPGNFFCGCKNSRKSGKTICLFLKNTTNVSNLMYVGTCPRLKTIQESV